MQTATTLHSATLHDILVPCMHARNFTQQGKGRCAWRLILAHTEQTAMLGETSLLKDPDVTDPQKQIPDYLELMCQNWHNELDGFVDNMIRASTMHVGLMNTQTEISNIFPCLTLVSSVALMSNFQPLCFYGEDFMGMINCLELK